jgi:hypothetical protein
VPRCQPSCSYPASRWKRMSLSAWLRSSASQSTVSLSSSCQHTAPTGVSNHTVSLPRCAPRFSADETVQHWPGVASLGQMSNKLGPCCNVQQASVTPDESGVANKPRAAHERIMRAKHKHSHSQAHPFTSTSTRPHTRTCAPYARSRATHTFYFYFLVLLCANQGSTRRHRGRGQPWESVTR